MPKESFYTSVELYGGSILYRGIEDGKRVIRREKYRPSLFVPTRKESEYRTIQGQPVKKRTFDSVFEARKFLAEYSNIEGYDVYGYTHFDLAYICDKFPNKIVYDPKKILVANIDIECECENGFPDPDVANERINAITLKIKNKYYIFGYDTDYRGKKFFYDNKGNESQIFVRCPDEMTLIEKFLRVWRHFWPDIVVGWNCLLFDIPYIVNRISRLTGENGAHLLSPWEKSRTSEIVNFGKVREVELPLGISVLDYLELYKKFVLKKHPRYSLDYISHVELGEKKLDYSQYANLHELYLEDYQTYLEYNARDVWLVDRLDEKKQLINLAILLAYQSKTNFRNVFAQVRMWETIIFDDFRKKKLVLPPRRENHGGKYAGAYVKEPVPGMYHWVVSFDLTSLYPHIIAQWNISPETLVDGFYNVNIPSIIQKKDDLSFLKERGCGLAANGHLFSNEQYGFLPKILMDMFADRKKFKGMAWQAKQELEKVHEQLESDPNRHDLKKKEKELEYTISKYSIQEQVLKVCLNSAYGFLGNKFGVFYDVRLAEAITLSGQLVIQWIEDRLNTALNKLLKNEIPKDYVKDYVIAMDTDSVYLNMDDLVRAYQSKKGEKSKQDIIEFLNDFSAKKIQPLLEKIFIDLSGYLNCYAQKMQMKREVIADKGVWTGKKRYMLNVWDAEGIRYQTPHLKIMGIESAKSDTPDICREKIEETIRLIMDKDEDAVVQFIKNFRAEFENARIEDVAIPKTMNNLQKYSDPTNLVKKGCPFHVRAALNYNRQLEEHNLTRKYRPIQEGEKGYFLYLKSPNPTGHHCIAFLDMFPPEFGIEEFIDLKAQFVRAYLKPVELILKAIGWNSKPQNKFLNSFVSYE